MSATATASATSARVRATGLVLLATVLGALFYYKWGGSLRAVEGARASGKLAIAPGAILDGGALATTLVYFGKIWPALTYGVLVGAAVRAALPASAVRRFLGGGGARPTLAGALVGAPLMLCSCCVTPVFTGLRRGGARLASSLAVMLASPGLNPAAIVLTFALLPPRVGVVRVVAALVVVLGLTAAIGRLFEPASGAACMVENVQVEANAEPLLVRFAREVLRLAAITVPLLVVGVLLSGLVLPRVVALSGAGLAVAVAATALVGTLAALPTFFEIPIALVLLSLGAPQEVVVAFVIAGPIVNLPSLLVLGREAGPRVAVALGAGVWLVATLAGFAAAIG